MFKYLSHIAIPDIMLCTTFNTLAPSNAYLIFPSQIYMVQSAITKHDVSILEDLPIIYREKVSGTRYTMDCYFESKGVLLKKQMELTSNEAVKQAIITGLGSSIMPLIGIKNEIQNGQLNIIPVKGLPIKSSWHIIWQKNKGFSPVASAFLNYLKKEKDQIIQKEFNWYEKY